MLGTIFECLGECAAAAAPNHVSNLYDTFEKLDHAYRFFCSKSHVKPSGHNSKNLTTHNVFFAPNHMSNLQDTTTRKTRPRIPFFLLQITCQTFRTHIEKLDHASRFFCSKSHVKPSGHNSKNSTTHPVFFAPNHMSNLQDTIRKTRPRMPFFLLQITCQTFRTQFEKIGHASRFVFFAFSDVKLVHICMVDGDSGRRVKCTQWKVEV